MDDYNEKYRQRSKEFTIQIIKSFVLLPQKMEWQVMGKQF
jgi:hypothetical protein